MWRYADLRAALAGMEGLTDAEAATALCGTNRTVVVDVPTRDARALLLATGEWGGLVRLARSQPSADRPEAIIAAAITAEDTLRMTEVLETTKPEAWAAVQAMVAALAGAGVISAASAAALLALREVPVPVWWPAPTEHDVARARAMGG